MNLPRFIFEIITPTRSYTRVITSNNFILASQMACSGIHNITHITFKGIQ